MIYKYLVIIKQMLRNIFRTYSTYVKKIEKKKITNLVEKMKDYKFYCDCTHYPCHCIHYGEPCKLHNNKDAHINFAKHILYINSKKTKEKRSNIIYQKQLDEWYF